MAGRPGFISRQVLAPVDGSEALITVTQWADETSYRDWVAHNKASTPPDAAPGPWVETPTTTVLRDHAPGS
jgi:heme-degrading monooxygenase HmoA